MRNDKIKILLCLVLFIFSAKYGYSNANPFRIKAEKGNARKECKLSVTTDTIFSIDTLQTSITGFAITGSIIQLDDDSFVRILLEDEEGKNYQVLETSRLYNDTDVVRIDSYGEETLFLNDVRPRRLKIFLTNAKVEIDDWVMSLGSSTKQQYSHSRFEQKRLASRQIQQLNIVDRINHYNIKHKALWRADTTSVSLLPWEQRKIVLGINDEGDNTDGIEYYAEGIFEVRVFKASESASRSSKAPDWKALWRENLGSTQFVDEFDWRNRHGKNWMTPVKDQWWTNGCWAFAAVGSCEAVANLYYNQKIDLDLSEQELISCSRDTISNPAIGGSPGAALNWISKNGIVDEEAMPFEGTLESIPCSEKSVSYSEHLFIKGIEKIRLFPDSIKKALIKHGPFPFFYMTGKRSAHVVLLSGFGKLKEGYSVRISTRDTVSNDTIDVNDPRIGKTYWICKNSYGVGNGENGYIKLYIPERDATSTPYSIKLPLTTMNYDSNDIVVSDADNDGYYFWGLGAKPTGCPDWIPDIPDGDDSDYSKGPMDEFGRLTDLNPDANDTIYIKTDSVSNKKRFIYNHTVITEGHSLSLNKETVFYNNVKLKVQRGGTLIVDAAVVCNADIIIETGANLIVRNNAEIKFAKNKALVIPVGANFELISGVIN